MLFAQIAIALIQLALLVGVITFLVTMVWWATSGEMDAPFVPTPVQYAGAVVASLDVQPGDVVYELGSGGARILLAMAGLVPDAQFVGIERNPLLYTLSLVRKRRAKVSNVTLVRGDFFQTELGKATKVYAYLLDTVMARLQPKFDREFKGRVASRAFPFPRKRLSNVVALTERIGAHGQHLLFIYDF